MVARDLGVLVFGASRGIGEVVATRFASAGYRVGVVARGESALRGVADRLGATAWVADVSDPAAVESVFEQFGRVDSVVHAAAIQGGPAAMGPTWETEPDAFAEVLRVNVTGAYHVLRGAIRAMRARGDHGTILLFSGGGSVSPRPRFAAYGTSKAAVVRLVETAQVELEQAGSSVRVYAVAPGAVRTAMTEEVAAAGERAGPEAAAAADILANGGVPPEEAADLCWFLSTEAPPALAGRLIHVREPYRELASCDPSDAAGRLRRAPYA